MVLCFGVASGFAAEVCISKEDGWFSDCCYELIVVSTLSLDDVVLAGKVCISEQDCSRSDCLVCSSVFWCVVLLIWWFNF